jgi:large subunit ribosomal protein L33
MRLGLPMFVLYAFELRALTWDRPWLGYRPFGHSRTRVMAKPTTSKIRLNSSGDTGFFYITRKNTRTMTEKFKVRKYDPVLRKHVEFNEGKIK